MLLSGLGLFHSHVELYVRLTKVLFDDFFLVMNDELAGFFLGISLDFLVDFSYLV